jgi:hypothetical protein
MHDSAVRGLRRLLAGVAVLALLVVAVLLLGRGCRTEKERLSAAVDDARDALVEHREQDFLAFFAPEVRYRGKAGRKDLERDLHRWVVEFRVGRVAIQERDIAIDGDRATIRLRCDVGTPFQSIQQATVDLAAEKRDGAWLVTSFDWK